MRNMFILAINTLKIAFKKKSNLIVFIVLPVLITIIMVFLNGSNNSKINIGICNNTKDGELTFDFIDSIKAQPKYNVILVKSEDVKSRVVGQKVSCVITIPENFDEQLYSGKVDKLEITTIKGADATAWIQSYVDNYIKNIVSIGKASGGDRVVFDEIYKGTKNQELNINVNTLKDEYKDKSISQTSVGLIIMLMLIGATTISGFMLKEKRERTYFRIIASPVNSKVYVGANILSGMVIEIIQSALVVLSISKLLKIDSKVPDLQMFFMLSVFGLVSVSIGILIVAFSDSGSQASSLSTLIITPSCMLSGCFWPISIMPEYMQKLSYFLPQRWLIVAIEKVQSTGMFTKALPSIAIMFGFAILFFLISIFKFKSNNSVNNFV